jgi:hypothetical protein
VAAVARAATSAGAAAQRREVGGRATRGVAVISEVDKEERAYVKRRSRRRGRRRGHASFT